MLCHHTRGYAGLVPACHRQMANLRPVPFDAERHKYVTRVVGCNLVPKTLQVQAAGSDQTTPEKRQSGTNNWAGNKTPVKIVTDLTLLCRGNK
ncbi:hypothetical protein EYF80_037542 [Liparis tanakae]|uniref:Uncharacterized protein n=1 Tax=Liparis tanakae TaxID=230148 RepID=A0A4Z2GFG0_9TELE|nr:hypothetical protein EYF80_037542 [Liparis tanakae]